MDDATEQPSPPAGLGPRGTALFNSVASRYSLRPDELAILADAAHECDVIEMLKAEFETRPLVTKGSMGQDAASPHLIEIRLHRACLATLLTKLRLPDEGASAPAGRGDAWSRSQHARKAANARWHPSAPR